MSDLAKNITCAAVADRPESLVIPDVFSDHHATPATIKLFMRWVVLADSSPNGTITIDPAAEEYSRATVGRAVQWLVQRHLLMKLGDGRGRGRHVRVFVRWSVFGSLTKRQEALNHPKREGADHDSKENASSAPSLARRALLEDGRLACSYEQDDDWRRSSFLSHLRENSTVIGKQIRWTFSRIRGLVDETLPDIERDERARLVKALGVTATRALKAGYVRRGVELERFIEHLRCGLLSLSGGEWPLWAFDSSHSANQAAFSWAAWTAGEAVRSLSVRRLIADTIPVNEGSAVPEHAEERMNGEAVAASVCRQPALALRAAVERRVQQTLSAPPDRAARREESGVGLDLLLASVSMTSLRGRALELAALPIEPSDVPERLPRWRDRSNPASRGYGAASVDEMMSGFLSTLTVVDDGGWAEEYARVFLKG